MRYAGKVGTGFSMKGARELADLVTMQPLKPS